MANHQNTDMEREQLNQARQAFWLSALMHSTDIEKTYQELRQSLIETHQAIQQSLNTAHEEAMLHSLSLTDNLSEKDKEELLKETRDMFLEIHKNAGTDEQSLKINLERELNELENIKNQVIDAKHVSKKRTMVITVMAILMLILGLYMFA